MAGLCKATIIGNLGADPDMRYSQDGKPRTRFNVACNSRRRGPDGEMMDHTDWFEVVCFGRLADIANEYLSRGRRVYVEGNLSSRTWDGKDGKRGFTMEIRANELVMLDAKGRGEADGQPMGNVARSEAPAHDGDVEDLPF